MGSSFGFDAMASIFPILFFAVFGVVIVIILVSVIRSVTRSVKNQNSPVLTVDARIVGKRAQTGGGMNDTAAWTHYFVTFEFEGGGRLEFQVDGEESGLLAEGDTGKVTFQGTRYISFVRKMQE